MPVIPPPFLHVSVCMQWPKVICLSVVAASWIHFWLSTFILFSLWLYRIYQNIHVHVCPKYMKYKHFSFWDILYVFHLSDPIKLYNHEKYCLVIYLSVCYLSDHLPAYMLPVLSIVILHLQLGQNMRTKLYYIILSRPTFGRMNNLQHFDLITIKRNFIVLSKWIEKNPAITVKHMHENKVCNSWLPIIYCWGYFWILPTDKWKLITTPPPPFIPITL